jgi:hypothetical protein
MVFLCFINQIILIMATTLIQVYDKEGEVYGLYSVSFNHAERFRTLCESYDGDISLEEYAKANGIPHCERVFISESVNLKQI